MHTDAILPEELYCPTAGGEMVKGLSVVFKPDRELLSNVTTDIRIDLFSLIDLPSLNGRYIYIYICTDVCIEMYVYLYTYSYMFLYLCIYIKLKTNLRVRRKKGKYAEGLE
jgi:hypothetical protein